MVAPDWNPNAPGKRGIEHLDVSYGHVTIDAPADVGELQFTAKRTGAIDTIELFAGNGAVAPVLDSTYRGLNRPMLVELVERGSEASGPITFNDFSVTQITGSTGMFNQDLTTPLVTGGINDFDTSGFIVSSQLGAWFEAQFDSNAYGLDRHVLAVEVHLHINLTTGVRRVDPVGVSSSRWVKTVPMWSSAYSLAVLRIGETIVDGTDTAWSHWTPDMIREFRGGGTRKLRISCAAGPGYWRINRLYMRVYSQPERRRGVGIGSPSSSLTWVPFTMATPNATGAPAVTLGEDLTLMCRRITDYSVDTVAGFTVMPWRYLLGYSPDGAWQRYIQNYNTLVGMDPPLNLVQGILAARMTAGGSVVADSMPYGLSRGAVCSGVNTVSQFITMAGDATVYGQVYVVAGWSGSAGRPEAPLRAEVYRVSDGVRVFSAVEITAADVDRLPRTFNDVDGATTYKLVQLRFPESQALAAGQYEMRFSSPGTTIARTWYIGAHIANVHSADQTFGGGTDYADGFFYSGSPAALTALTGGDFLSDIQAQLVEVPAAVTGTGASVGSLTAHHLELCDPNQGCEGCADDTMPYTQITWSPHPSGSPDIVGYDIDRLDDLSPDWERVATIDGRLSTVWNDHEVRIGVRSQYRVRAVRADGVVGEWSAATSVSVPPGQVALAFSSNAATGMGCVYPEVWEGNEAERGWAFLEAGDVSLRRVYGRNRQVAFRPMERRGDSFERTVLLNALCNVARPSMATFNPLRDLAWAPIPYVCVRDGEGNRWFASLVVPDGANRRADANGTELWLATIGVTEIADGPAVHDTSIPQVERPARL